MSADARAQFTACEALMAAGDVEVARRVLCNFRGCSSVVERPLCMRKAQGSNPCSSNFKTTPWRNG